MVETLSSKIYAPVFGFQKCDRAGLGWAGDYQNILGKVGGSEMELVGSMYMLLTRAKIQCVFGDSKCVLWTFYM